MSFSVKLFIENSFTSFRIYNEANIEKFKKSLIPQFFNTPDANLQYSAFHNLFKNSSNKKEKNKPLKNYWITTDLKYCLKRNLNF